MKLKHLSRNRFPGAVWSAIASNRYLASGDLGIVSARPWSVLAGGVLTGASRLLKMPRAGRKRGAPAAAASNVAGVSYTPIPIPVPAASVRPRPAPTPGPAPAPPTVQITAQAPAAATGRKRKLDDKGLQKYYAVRAGVRPGIYLTWNECQAQIAGFRGAQCMAFLLSSPFCLLSRMLIYCPSRQELC